MRVVFLDVDGVLNSQTFADAWYDRTGQGGWGGHFTEADKATHENVIWDEECVNELRRIVETTDSQIVVSSTWRKFFTIEKFKEMFAVYGWKDAPIIAKTPAGYRTRGMEINNWLSEHPVDNYVILDDYPDFMSQQINNFVNTNAMYGLSKKDADKAISILNSNNGSFKGTDSELSD